VEAPNFATLVERPIVVNVSETVRVEVTVTAEASLADTSTNTLGAVVTGLEILELPLNGRNFTQLGLLQNGVAPLTDLRGGVLNLIWIHLDRIRHRRSDWSGDYGQSLRYDGVVSDAAILAGTVYPGGRFAHAFLPRYRVTASTGELAAEALPASAGD
jgi:hypothetical protein